MALVNLLNLGGSILPTVGFGGYFVNPVQRKTNMIL